MLVKVIPKVVSGPYPRTRLPMFLYILSIALALFLFYWSGVYCSVNPCRGEPEDYEYYSRHYIQYFPTVVSPIIVVISTGWLITAFVNANNACSLAYNYMEMPSAVFCSLLAGISAVIEIHFSIDFNHLRWTESWCWTAAVAVALCGIHATVAFALQ